jgi:hypothetical protein
MARLYVAAFLKNDRQIRCLVKLPLRVYNPDSPSGTPLGLNPFIVPLQFEIHLLQPLGLHPSVLVGAGTISSIEEER